MKIRMALLVFLFSMLLVISVGAPFSSLSSGYAIWTDYHGIDVPGGTTVTATAGTTEYPGYDSNPRFPDVMYVRFRWMPPVGSGLPDVYSPALGELPKPLTWDGNTYYNGWRVYTANDTLTLNTLGDWGVQAWFYDSGGNLRNESGVEKIRAVSINVVPDVPIIGTAGAAAAMLICLGLFLHRKKKNQIKNAFTVP